jgi:hypothetical protein
VAVEEEIERHVMALDEEFKSYLLQKHIGTMVSVRFIANGDVVDTICCLFVEACNSDCITLSHKPVKKLRRPKARAKTPVTTRVQKRSHIPVHYISVINNPSGVVLCFDRWWWDNDF